MASSCPLLEHDLQRGGVRRRLFHPHRCREVEHLRQFSEETKYFYQDLDEAGDRLNGSNRYAVTFAKGQLPPVNGFWSLTLYNQHHFFAPNELKRYSLGTKSKSMKPNPDGSLTIYVQADPPADDRRDNWLPAPKGEDFSLYVRAYWPKVEVTDGSWTPPPVKKVE